MQHINGLYLRLYPTRRRNVNSNISNGQADYFAGVSGAGAVGAAGVEGVLSGAAGVANWLLPAPAGIC